MTKQEFLSLGEKISGQAGVLDGLHGYFQLVADRVHECMDRFGLFSGGLGDVLEIGAFYGYAPFALRPRANSYLVLEGDDPAVHALLPVYKAHSIDCTCIDLFDLFGPIHGATHRLPLPDASFDTLLCWETMEHFNFNPVKFVRELHRVLKPGGKVCITVPNRASFQSLVSMLVGRGEQHVVNGYFQYEDYVSAGKKAFYGYHWREYSHGELAQLFATAGFKIKICKTIAVFQGHGKQSLMRRLAR